MSGLTRTEQHTVLVDSHTGSVFTPRSDQRFKVVAVEFDVDVPDEQRATYVDSHGQAHDVQGAMTVVKETLRLIVDRAEPEAAVSVDG
jgi:hypothetical protein